MCGLVEYNAPVNCCTKVLGNMLQVGEVDIMRAGRELGEGSDSIANVRAANDIGIHEFTKQGAKGEAMFLVQGCMLRCAFIRAHMVVYLGNGIHGEGSRMGR